MWIPSLVSEVETFSARLFTPTSVKVPIELAPVIVCWLAAAT